MRHLALTVVLAVVAVSAVTWAAAENRICVHVVQAPLNQVVLMIAKAGGVNVVVPPELAQRTVAELKLDGVSVSEAFAKALSPYGYEAVLENNVYLVRLREGAPPAPEPAVPPPTDQQKIERVLPLRHVDATQIATLFGVASSTPTPPEAPSPAHMDEFIAGCLRSAASDISHSAGQWQYCLEMGFAPPLMPQGVTRGGMAGLLPRGVTVEALPAANSLRVSGLEDAVNEFQEILDLLDKPMKRVALQIELLQGTPVLLGRLQVANWTQTESSPVFRFTTSTLANLRQTTEETGAPLRLAGTMTVNNGAALEVRAGEVLPRWWSATAADAPAVRVNGQFLNMRLIPRVNADASVTVLVEASTVVGETQPPDSTRLAPQVSRIVGRTQVRAGSGETIAMALGHLTDAEGQPVGDEALLARPILLITPRPLGASTSQARLEPDHHKQ